MSPSFERKLGHSELSYFLPSREDGVNDMYLHLGIRAPSKVINPERILLAWAILRGRHPLLASQVVMEPGKYDSARFIYSPPPSLTDGLEEARSNFIFAQQSVEDSPKEFNLLICAVHFLGDGVALHTLANDLFSLLASSSTSEGKEPPSIAELNATLEREWVEAWANVTDIAVLPPSLEARLPQPLSVFQRVAHTVEFRCAQKRLIGGHAFPKSIPLPERKRHTIVRTFEFDEETSKRILSKCKAEGVSIAHVLFAACNVAWIRIGKASPELPMMMYSALNLRPYLPPPPRSLSPLASSYWFLAIGYFNVVLPSFSNDSSRLVWHRARLAKKQCLAAAKTRLLLSRTNYMAEERGNREKVFAALDDGLHLPPASVTLPPTPASTPDPTQTSMSRTLPSTALLGLSLLGNLDSMYKHSLYPSITLHTSTGGSRQRKGGLLVFGCTFAGKLGMSLGYDEGAYKAEVGAWWDEVRKEITALCY
ncbi:hypothetical protein M422DRAFT_233571 [Sphaerobolus stellatus SS14]|uniref:Alcohol acetyltransferase n=1 Tax=Sphaerobolus stellatus (strain SS14) TaxID=990650 RepID=A0A0C9UGT3_SPHS4|nr:hypothetical protein M422DRAFT_233568 [Sphaerobolus stellatus SS14]KIJ33996.1 hypothetical protein M422DRAFT_233571 [Sphaerobolus stellatus SS14]